MHLHIIICVRTRSAHYHINEREKKQRPTINQENGTTPANTLINFNSITRGPGDFS